MPTYRYPALVCRDAAGGFSAFALDTAAVGFGASAAYARTDLREYLGWFHRKRPWAAGPDFRDPELSWHTVSARPEYRTEDRVHPCEAAVPLKVACVTGVRASGQPTAELPLLGVRFDYARPVDLPDFVRRYALQKLEGLSPADLARHLPPASVELAEVAVRVPKNPRDTAPPAAPPTLGRVAEALGDRAARKGLARAWGREAEVAALVKTLHSERANVLLVGEPGVGKTTLLADAVRQAEKQVPEGADPAGPRPRRFWLTSAGRLVAGMKYLGQWEERAEEVVAELGELSGVLCAERLLDLVRRGGKGPADSVAAFLVPYLARGELRMAAEATPAELDACRRLLPALPDLFQVVPVRPFDRPEALAVIDRQLQTSASGPGVAVGRGTGERVVRLFARFLPYAPFPGPAAGFARELVEAHARAGATAVGPDDVVDRFRRRTGLPELFLRDELTLARPDVLGWFGRRVVGQPEACDAAADVVLRVKAGLTDPGRPPAVLLFCGPTGVGKTETAKALADYVFGHGDGQEKERKADSPLLRLDMSEFGGFDAVSRLLGPPGGEPGELVRRVRRRPFCVVLLDEIEKAHRDVFDTLMGVFDEGRLTDQYGRVTDFRSAVIVMTSNLGAGGGGGFGFGPAAGPQYRDEAMRFFRPEFFNRMDAVVTFGPLRPDGVRAIARRELEAIARRDGLAGVTMVPTERLVDHLAAAGFDARYGARPLQRAVERQVVAPLARWLLAHPGPTARTVSADWAAGGIEFRAAAD